MIHLEALRFFRMEVKLIRGILVPGEDVSLISLILASSTQVSISYTFHVPDIFNSNS